MIDDDDPAGGEAIAWRSSERCCERHSWTRELVGRVLTPASPLEPDRAWRIISADEAPAAALADDFGLVGVAVDLRRVRVSAADELIVEDRWDAATGRYSRSIRPGHGADPSGQAFKAAWRVAQHVFDGKPFRGLGGAPATRTVDVGRVASMIVALTETTVPRQEEVASKVGYADVRGLQRAIPGVAWSDLLRSAAEAYQAAGSLQYGGRSAWQPWKALWPWSRQDLEHLGDYDEAKHRALLEAADRADKSALDRWAKRNRVTILTGRP